MSWDIELAKELKKRDNFRYLGPLIGTIISLEPIKVSVLDNQCILTSVYVLKSNLEHTRDVRINGVVDCGASSVVGKMTVKNKLKIGMEVLVLPTWDNQRFFIVGEVEK